MTQDKATEFKLSATGNYVPTVTIRQAEDAAKFAMQFYHDDIMVYESAFIILTNTSGKVIGWAKIAQGGISATIVDVRIVAKIAVDALAAGVIFVHNHPSGNLVASPQDVAITKRIKSGLEVLDIKMLDSIILAPNGEWYSFCDNCRI